jgi:hypothetical protein
VGGVGGSLEASVTRARMGEVPRVGVRRSWPAKVTRLGVHWREVAWRREILDGGGWAALAISTQLGGAGGRSRGGGRSLAAAAAGVP